MKPRISVVDISMKNCRHHGINPPQVTAADSFYNLEREVQIRVKNNKRGFFRANPLMHSHLYVSITVALMQHNIVMLAASIGSFFPIRSSFSRHQKRWQKPFRFPCNSSTISSSSGFLILVLAFSSSAISERMEGFNPHRRIKPQYTRNTNCSESKYFYGVSPKSLRLSRRLAFSRGFHRHFKPEIASRLKWEMNHTCGKFFYRSFEDDWRGMKDFYAHSRYFLSLNEIFFNLKFNGREKRMIR